MAHKNPPWLRREGDRVVQEKRTGLFEGKVEYIDDPMNNGRIKVRVAGPMGGDVPTLDLPWALPCFMPGSFQVPEVGDTVLLYYRKNDVRYPVYLGVIYGLLREEDKNEARIKGRLPGLQDPAYKNYEQGAASVGEFEAPTSNNKLTYEQPAGNDAPLESFIKRSSAHPYVRVFASTPKGHTIYTTDEPEGEALRIIDRGGQIFEMESRIQAVENEGNMARRGIGEADSGTQVPLEKFYNETARMQWVDATQQRLQFESRPGAAKIRLAGIQPNTQAAGVNSRGSGWIEIREIKQEIHARSDREGWWKLDNGWHAEDEKGANIDIHNNTIVLTAGTSTITITPTSIALSSDKIDLN